MSLGHRFTITFVSGAKGGLKFANLRT
jgi:hypothetical protein